MSRGRPRAHSLSELRYELRRRIKRYRADMVQFPDNALLPHRAARIVIRELSRVDKTLRLLGTQLPRGKGRP